MHGLHVRRRSGGRAGAPEGLDAVGDVYEVEEQHVLDKGDHPDTDAIIISCTALPTYNALPDLEERTGKPVIAVAVVRVTGSARGESLQQCRAAFQQRPFLVREFVLDGLREPADPAAALRLQRGAALVRQLDQ